MTFTRIEYFSMLTQFTGDNNDPLYSLLTPHQEIGVVLYPDGGYDHTTRKGGWGIHGYCYSKEIPKKGSGCPTAHLTLDGYSKIKPDTAITPLCYIDAIGSLATPDTTSNTAEIHALVNAIRFINHISTLYNVTHALILQDSQHAVNCANGWAQKIKDNQWRKPDGDMVEMRPLLETLLVALEQKTISIVVDKVKGHNGDLGNTLADNLATDGKAIANNDDTITEMAISDASGYWKNDANFNAFLRQGIFTFVTNNKKNYIEKHQRFYYHFANLFKDSVQGERHVYNGYSVVYTKTPDVVFQRVIEHQNTLGHSPTAVSIVEADLSVVLNKRIYSKIMGGGHRFFSSYDTPHKFGRGIALSGNRLTGVFNPPLKAFSVLEIFTHLHELLCDILHNKNNTSLVLTEITDHLYEPVIEKKPLQRKLKKEINGSFKFLTVDVNHSLTQFKPVATRLILETDLPSRNVLAAIGDDDPKVYVITWTESHNAIRYATVVTTTHTEAIYCGPYANLRVLCK